MIIYPAIDIMDGRCVRLTQGDFNRKTVFEGKPVDIAKSWEAQGAQALHVIDLDGARIGKPQNTAVIAEIIKSVAIPVQVGGGLRSEADIIRLFEEGAAKTIIGTSAIQDEALLETAFKKYRDKVIISIDAVNGFVAVNGWVNMSQVSAYSFAKKAREKGLREFVYTDISRDGMQRGPDFTGIERMMSIEGTRLIASGGIKDVKDLERLKNAGVYGAIIGKSLYDGSLKLEAALTV